MKSYFKMLQSTLSLPINSQKLPTNFLLTTSVQYQDQRLWELKMITKGLANFQIRRQQKQLFFLNTNPCNKLFECYARVSMVLFQALVIIYGLTL